jgi:ABC-type phosphate transport system substrate-binding protein
MLFAAAPASAETIYAGGGTLAAGLFRHWLDCRGAILNSPGLPVVAPSSCATADRTANLYAYAGVGSGAGVTAFLGQTSPTAVPTAPAFPSGAQDWFSTAQSVSYPYPRFDFAGSDASLTDAQINTYISSVQPTRHAAVQVPVVATPVTIPVNITGLNINRPIPSDGKSGLYLSRANYCGIFNGTITDWSDSRLTTDNLGVALAPAGSKIKVFVRSDSSGTTFLLSRHLQAVCSSAGFPWTGGAATTVTWPTVAGSFVPVAGSGGMASSIAATQFSIGYVSPDYTQMVATPVVTPAPVVANLQNQADIGKAASAVTPRAPSIAATTAGVSGFAVPTINDARHWSAAIEGGTVTGSTQIIPTTTANKMRNPPATATTAYPITGFTMVNFYGCYATATQTTAVKDFATWYVGSSANASFLAQRDGFSPLTGSLKTTIATYLGTAITGC